MNKSYTWDALDYAKSSSAQQIWARELITKLNLQGDERVLDIGCGEGKVTAEIANLVPHGSVVGIDNSEAMLELAKTRYSTSTFPNLQFLCADARQLPFEQEFTVIFSNATLHWIKDHVSVIQGISNSLQSGGKVLLQMGGRGNAAEIIRVVEEMTNSSKWRRYFANFPFPYGFYSPDEYQHWLKDVGLEPIRLELIPKDMTHQGATGLAGWIRTTWLPYTQQLPEQVREDFVKELVERYLEYHPVKEDGLTHVKMVRLEVEAIKC
ncbi:MAG: methyltransferase domain-containing protein [Symploca sp. SIO1B1]|nr:methyltransferase domain-containing protein [Symploca sp. SIO1B1]